MNPRSFYNKQKDVWEDKESDDLYHEYTVNKMTVSQIANIHHRTPGCIAFKLKSLGLVIKHTDTHGYSEYLKSALYKEIVSQDTKITVKKPTQKQVIVSQSEEILELRNDMNVLKQYMKTLEMKTDVDHLKRNLELLQLKNEVRNLKHDTQEILKLMNAIYDFETH